MKCLQTEYAPLFFSLGPWLSLKVLHFYIRMSPKLTMVCARKQGYEVSEEELKVSLEEFARKYADPMGYPEYATPPRSCFCPTKTWNSDIDILSVKS